MLNKPSVLEPVLEPTIKPILDISNMDISNSDEEDEHVIYIDTILGSFSTSVSILEPELDTPSSSTSQNIQDSPNPTSPQPINVPPPPTILLQSIFLREVCKNIFKDLMQLVKTRNDPIHSENYEGKWISLREVVDRVFNDLQRLSIEARN